MQHRNTQTHHFDTDKRIEKAQDAVRRFWAQEQLPDYYSAYMPHYFTIVELHNRVQRAEAALSKLVAERILEPSP